MFHSFPSLAEVAPEKELCCGRGCLSLGEQEKGRGSSFLQLHNQRATDLLHLPKLFLNSNACFVLFCFASGERHGKEREMPKVRSQGTDRGGGRQIPPWRTHGLLYHFSQGVGAIPDVGLLEVYLSEPAGMMGSRRQSWPSQRQRAAEKKRDTATAADDPSCKALGQGLQRGHGSRSKVVCPSRSQLQHPALMRESSVSIRESGQGKERETQRLWVLPLLWF